MDQRCHTLQLQIQGNYAFEPIEDFNKSEDHMWCYIAKYLHKNTDRSDTLYFTSHNIPNFKFSLPIIDYLKSPYHELNENTRNVVLLY